MTTVTPLSRMRKAITRTVMASVQVPQYSIEVDVSFVSLNERRAELTVNGVKPSVADVIHHATVSALRDHPWVNASFTDDGIAVHEDINLAFILEQGDGMVTPAIMNAGTMTITELAAERQRLTQAAATGSLTPAELMSGTFTVSNLGPLGIHRFNAMVLPPQAAVLAVGAPTVDGVLTLTLTSDHRVIDGAPGARFLRAIAQQIEGATS